MGAQRLLVSLQLLFVNGCLGGLKSISGTTEEPETLRIAMHAHVFVAFRLKVRGLCRRAAVSVIHALVPVTG